MAAAAVAILVALFSSDATRDIIVNAKASMYRRSFRLRPQRCSPIRATTHVTQLKGPARLSAPENQTPGARSVTTAAVAPTREEIKTAYQSALQSGAPPAAAVAEPMIPGDAIHHLDPNEIASLLRRGDDLIASGDLAAARLVLRRAANAGDAHAAMTLAETYDPAISGETGRPRRRAGLSHGTSLVRESEKVRSDGGASAARTARKQAAIIGAPYGTFQSHVYCRRIFAANRPSPTEFRTRHHFTARTQCAADHSKGQSYGRLHRDC